MHLPQNLIDQREWTFIGPMGPELPSKFLSHSVLAVDGGAHFTGRMDVWVGDADSFKENINCPHVFAHPRDKASSDLALALGLFPEGTSRKIHLWGMLGGRKDHELFNLGESLLFLEERAGSEITFYEQNGRVALRLYGAGSWSFERSGEFSLGALREVKVGLTGQCQWPITPQKKLGPLSSLGLSNVGRGKIELVNEGPVFVYFPEEA